MQHSSSISPIETAIEAALERLGDQHQRSAQAADTAESRRFFRRWAGAFRKALLFYHEGVRAEQLASGAWLVPSATRAIVHQVGKDGACSCEAQSSGCWHAALVAGVEVGYEDLDTFGTDPDDPDAPRGVDDTTDDEELPTDGPTEYHVGAYVRDQVLESMLERSAAEIARLRAAEIARLRAAELDALAQLDTLVMPRPILAEPIAQLRAMTLELRDKIAAARRPFIDMQTW